MTKEKKTEETAKVDEFWLVGSWTRTWIFWPVQHGRFNEVSRALKLKNQFACVLFRASRFIINQSFLMLFDWSIFIWLCLQIFILDSSNRVRSCKIEPGWRATLQDFKLECSKFYSELLQIHRTFYFRCSLLPTYNWNCKVHNRTLATPFSNRKCTHLRCIWILSQLMKNENFVR